MSATVEQLLSSVDGRLLRGDRASVPCQGPLESIVIDSREAEPGRVFWALEGTRCNGVDFVDDAFRRGASGAVVSRAVDVPEGRWAVVVDDTRNALWQWAERRRDEFHGVLIAVTGSVGKTTTRQMIDTILRSRLRGTASLRNYNNHLGVPLSMAAIEPDHDYAVLELGASQPGEVAELAELCQPRIGVITQVGDAHLGTFGSHRVIAASKAELLAALPEDGHAVLGDDPWLRQIVHRGTASVTWVGEDEHCELAAQQVHAHDGQLSFDIDGRHFTLPVWGRHHLTAALAAIGVGRLLGFSLEEMADVLEDFQPVPMRCEVIQARGATVINDTYNANPTAMRAALALVADVETTGRRIVVLGEMAELGPESDRLHRELGEQTVTLGRADLLIACGPSARCIVEGAREAGVDPARAIACNDWEQTLPHLGQAIVPGDVVLVKGSRVMQMERVVDALEHYPLRRSA